jgi:phospholipid/cholesterol/gamma-HCH transport system substrate-binding protein
VKLSIVRKEAVRIRQGTIARIVNKGLLGDKMLELEVPDPSAPALEEGGTIKSEDPQDLSKYIEKIGGIAGAAQRTLDNMEAATKPLADPKFTQDLKGVVGSLNEILSAVVHNDSAAHRLIMDPREGEKVDRMLTNIDLTTQQLSATMEDVRDVTTHVRQGPGLAHAVVYDGELSQNAAGTLAEVHKDLEAIREGNGIAHAIIYGDDNTQHVMSNLNAMSDDLRKIVADVRAGKGTLGALLVDPSVYEDIKGAVGNVERNEVLRALVRYSIQKDEQKPASAHK